MAMDGEAVNVLLTRAFRGLIACVMSAVAIFISTERKSPLTSDLTALA